MKILHVTTIDLTAYCFLRTTFRSLRAAGHEVALACLFERFRDDLEKVTDHLYSVNIPRRIRPLQDLRALFDVMKVLHEFRPDIIHTHTSKAGFIGRLAAFIMRVPVIVHTIHELPQNSTKSALMKWFYRLLEKLAATCCDHLVTVSRVNQEQILRERICSPERLSLIPGGLLMEEYVPSTSREQIRECWALPEGSIALGMAGRLEPVKGHSDLLQAFALLAPRHPRLHLILMGTGHLLPQLRDQVHQSGLGERIHFLGWVEDLVSNMAALDVFVLSSHYEGLGVVLLEALALGIPVVSTQVGGTQDIVEQGITGLFAPPHSPAALADAIHSLLVDPVLARRLADAGQQKVREQYDAKDSDRQILALYQSLLGSRT